MTRIHRSLAVAALVASSFATADLAAPTDARAGAVTLTPATCTKYRVGSTDHPDGGGFCEGSFSWFRFQSADPTAHVQFSMSTPGFYLFYIVLGGQVTACNPNAAVKAIWPQAMTLRGWFHIDFDHLGNCTTLWLSNDSAEVQS